MKILVLAFVSSVFYIFSNVNHVTDGQRISDPNRTFQIFDFDYSNRGGFNMTFCMNELLNCWEVIRGDVICLKYKYRSTICDFLRDNMCSDYYGRIERNTYEVTLYEAYCKNDWWQEWTK